MSYMSNVPSMRQRCHSQKCTNTNIKYLKCLSIYDVIYVRDVHCTHRTYTAIEVFFWLDVDMFDLKFVSLPSNRIWKPTTSCHNVHTAFVHAQTVQRLLCVQRKIWQLRVNKCRKLFRLIWTYNTLIFVDTFCRCCVHTQNARNSSHFCIFIYAEMNNCAHTLLCF